MKPASKINTIIVLMANYELLIFTKKWKLEKYYIFCSKYNINLGVKNKQTLLLAKD